MDEELEIKNILDSFDSSFKILEDIKYMSKHQRRCVLDKIIKEIDTEEFVVDIELPRIWNTAAFLHVILNEYDKALIYARKSSDQDAHNINSKIIQAYCHLRRAEIFESWQICDELEKLRSNKRDILLAKAEMAFTYSRLGMELFKLAEKAYTEVIQECKEVPDVPVGYVCLWKFGLALAMKRTLNIHNIHEYNKSMYTTDRFKTMFRVFNEVAQTNDDTVAKFVARACVEIGLIVNSTEKGHTKDIVPPEVQTLKSDDYFVKALTLCPNDNFVLERSGKHYRYNNEIQRSIDLLSKAVSIRSTSFGHHHLALSLKRQLDIPYMNYRPYTHGTDSRGKHRGGYQQMKNRYRQSSSMEKWSREEYLPRRQHTETFGAGHTESGSARPAVYAKDSQDTDKHTRDSQRGRPEKFAFGVENMIKSPKKIIYLESDKTTDAILFHLDEAYKLAENVGAWYDKGLLLRQLKEPDKALEIFKNIMNQERTSLLQLANSYEQAAYCLTDIETTDEDPDGAERRQYNIKTYLKKSIEIGFTMVANIPLLCEAWDSFPTLNKLLCDQVNTKRTLKELAFVHEKLKRYKDAIGCYDQIVEMEGNEEKKTEVYLKMVENYIKIGDYDEAVLCLDMIMCLPEALHKINPGLYLSTYIEAGLDAVRRGETNIAGVRLRKALDYSKTLAKATKTENTSPHDCASDSNNEDCFDIYIHCDDSVKDSWRQLKDILVHAGLRTILNSDDDMSAEAVEFCLETSTHCIIITECNEETLTPHAQEFINQALRDRAAKKYGNVVMVQGDNTEMMSKLTMLPSVVFRLVQEYTHASELSQGTLDQLTDLMFKLATPNE